MRAKDWAARAAYKAPKLISGYHFLWAWAGAAIRRRPSRKIITVGITGTKGKTTTLELLNAILEEDGKRTALLSSLRVKVGDENRKNPVGNSMPGRAYIQTFLTRAVRGRCEYALIEVTSQGILQHRHRFVDWRIGALTNLSPEHIEAHGSFENYREAKLDFLRYVIRGGGKVFLNRDDAHHPFFERALPGGVTLSVSKDEESVREYIPAKSEAGGFLESRFNRENAAVAIAIAKELGVAAAAIKSALAKFKGVAGRAEALTAGPYGAVVDYAHTPDSLEAIYSSIKPHGRLICVLGGTGGGRDRWKRPAMGKIAARYCDEIVLADEDPYDEDPRAILEEVRQGILSVRPEGDRVRIVPDRREAIRTAVEMMRAGDVVIGTGKGSEDWIHVANGKKIPWSEREAFEEALRSKRDGAASLS